MPPQPPQPLPPPPPSPPAPPPGPLPQASLPPRPRPPWPSPPPPLLDAPHHRLLLRRQVAPACPIPLALPPRRVRVALLFTIVGAWCFVLPTTPPSTRALFFLLAMVGVASVGLVCLPLQLAAALRWLAASPLADELRLTPAPLLAWRAAVLDEALAPIRRLSLFAVATFLLGLFASVLQGLWIAEIVPPVSLPTLAAGVAFALAFAALVFFALSHLLVLPVWAFHVRLEIVLLRGARLADDGLRPPSGLGAVTVAMGEAIKSVLAIAVFLAVGVAGVILGEVGGASPLPTLIGLVVGCFAPLLGELWLLRRATRRTGPLEEALAAHGLRVGREQLVPDVWLGL